jgi:hypothetical protein
VVALAQSVEDELVDLEQRDVMWDDMGGIVWNCFHPTTHVYCWTTGNVSKASISANCSSIYPAT